MRTKKNIQVFIFLWFDLFIFNFLWDSKMKLLCAANGVVVGHDNYKMNFALTAVWRKML